MDPITLRLIERILAVAIGGLAIFLGYRLFSKVPTAQDSEGKLVLPWNISIVLTRIGPGVFFALYGAAVVTYALHQAVTYTSEQVPAMAGAAAVAKQDFRGIGQSFALDPAESLRARARIVFLSQAQRRLTQDAGGAEKLSIESHVGALKLAVMEPIWRETWGDRAAFRLWVEAGASGSAPPGLENAVAYYRSGLEDGR